MGLDDEAGCSQSAKCYYLWQYVIGHNKKESERIGR